MSSMLYDRENLANAKLTASLTTSASTVTVDDASVFSGLGDFYATIMPAGEMSRKSNSEIVKCTYASATTLAITRAQRGTTAKEFASGAIITNGIYTEDLEQVQSVGNTVFDTSYSYGVYTITSGNAMLPAIPTDGMRITIRASSDSSGTPGLDLQGTGEVYSIYSGTMANSIEYANSNAAELINGEIYELVFDGGTGGGVWTATNLMDMSNSVSTASIQDGAVTSSKINKESLRQYSDTSSITVTNSSDIKGWRILHSCYAAATSTAGAYYLSTQNTVTMMRSCWASLNSGNQGEVLTSSGANGGISLYRGMNTNYAAYVNTEIVIQKIRGTETRWQFTATGGFMGSYAFQVVTIGDLNVTSSSGDFTLSFGKGTISNNRWLVEPLY